MNPTQSKSIRKLLLAQGCLILAASAMAQVAPAESKPEAAPAPSKTPVVERVPAANASDNGDQTVMLSPFEVVSDNSKGYYAANSMSGTRFNTSLQDLAAPVSVVTREQMEDFGMLNINDVFLYSTNVEGTGTYSDFQVDRNGQMADNVQMNPNTANRVRGIASANISYGNFETSTRAPLDPLVLDGVEISRGPNANVFGLGNPSGTVNQVPAYARLDRSSARTEFRVDSYGGHRASFDTNQVLLKGKLAVRVSALDEREAFVRKPSGLDNNRVNAIIRFKPFKNTTINASYLFFKSEGNRPNFTPPRDYVSYWVNSGKPTWNPVTQTVHVNGQSYDHAAMIAAGNAGGTRTDAFIGQIGQPWNSLNRSGGQFQRSNVFIDQSGVTYWTSTANATGSTPAANTGAGAAFIRLMGTSPGPNGASGKYTNQPLFNSVPSVSDKNVYDWSSINLASPNFISDKVKTYYVTLDQTFFNTTSQMLVGQVGFFRETADRYRKTPIGDAGGAGGVNGQLWVDVNETNLDGTANPYLGSTYIGVGEPTYSYIPLQWDTTRAQLAYKYDFTKSNGFAKWFGSHQISPYYEYKYRLQRKYSYRDAIASNPSWLVAGQPGVVANFAPANQSNITGGPQSGPNVARIFQRYYVGDANGTDVDFAPGKMSYGSIPFHWGTTGNWRAEPYDLEMLATTDQTGGPQNTKMTIKTKGAVLQSHWLDGLLVTTFGVREDYTYSKQGQTPQLLTNNNTEQDFVQNYGWETRDYRTASGRTKTAGIVARPFRDVAFLNRWVNHETGLKHFVGELLRDSVIYYNKSDNFIPSPPAVDLFLNDLPNQTGKGTDMGIWFNLFSNKLVVRINRYENKQINARDGDANTVAQRSLRLDLDVSTDRHRLYTRATDWTALTNPTWSASQVEDSVFQQMKMTRDQYTALVASFRAGTIAATNDITAKGTEVEVNYNPTRYWTISANGEEKTSVNSNISGTVQDWIDARMPVWTSIVDLNTNPLLIGTSAESQGWTAASQTVPVANPNHLWFLHRYGSATQSASENLTGNVLGPYSILKQQEGKARPQVRKYAARLSTNIALSGLTSAPIIKNFSVGGAIRWEDRGSIGYYGVEKFPAVITRLDGNNPIWDDPRFYADVNVAYKMKLWNNKVSSTIRLNVRNIQEGGRLQATGAFPNGEIHSYRIVDPRQFILTAAFDF